MKKGHEKAQTDLNWVHLYLKNGSYPPGLTAIEKRIVRKRAEQFCFMQDELFFLGTIRSKEIGQVARKVLLTYEERWEVVKKAHIALDGTHLGLERTLEPITDKYYWVGIHRFARDYIRQCNVCLERNPRLGQGGSLNTSYASSVTDDDGSSIGDDTLTISGTETVSTSGDIDSEQYPGFTRETANTFWEKVDLRLYGPLKASEKNTYILMAVDGFSLWPEAFALHTVSPSTIAQSLLKLICSQILLCEIVYPFSDLPKEDLLSKISKESLELMYGQMGKLVISQEDIVLETAILKALEQLRQEGFMDIGFSKSVVENTGELYDEFEDLLEPFVNSHPNTWADSVEFCLLPLRSSCPILADYTPSFLAHSRELHLPMAVLKNDSPDSESDRSLKLEPFMSDGQKKEAVETLMNLTETIMRNNTAPLEKSGEEKFVLPRAEKSVEKDYEAEPPAVTRVMVTRTRTGSVKPKQFDDESYITPGKRKASSPAVTPDLKKVKVEIVGSPEIIKTAEAAESASKSDEVATKKADGEDKKEHSSELELDIPTVAQSGTKITVDLDHFYKSIRQYLTNQTYLPNSSYNFKKLIRETSKQYRLVANHLYYIADPEKPTLKVITSKEERLELLEWAHTKDDEVNHLSCNPMLEELKTRHVHWKGKNFDCESFALACPDCENYEKKIKLALKNMQEEKKLISYDTTSMYNDIRSFVRKDIYISVPESDPLAGIKKHLNSFKVELDQLMYITDMKKKKVIISPAERVKLIAEAHIDRGKHLDVKATLSKVLGGYFWFGMKMDVKIFVTYCCNVGNGTYLIDRYFLFRAHFMRKGSNQDVSRVIRVPEVTSLQNRPTEEERIFTATKLVVNEDDDVYNLATNNEHGEREPESEERPSGIFVSTIGTDSENTSSNRPNSQHNIPVTLTPVSRSAVPNVEITVITSESEPSEKGDQSGAQNQGIGTSDGKGSGSYEVALSQSGAQTAISGDDHAETPYSIKISEADTKNVVVVINERGDSLNAKLEENIKSAQSQENSTARDSDPVTMAAVKSILPEEARAVANVLSEVEVGGDATSPSKISDTFVEMRDNAVNTATDLVVNESELLEEETDSDEDDDDGENDDEDGEGSSDVSTPNIHSELLSRLTEVFVPAKESEDAEKKVVKPRQYYKCNICHRVFYGPNKFKTHIYRHTGQKPFACSMCNKKYTNNKSLMIHERTHTGELPYLCNTCGKRMVSKVSLKSHMKVHDGKGGGMPCKCDICGREFTRRHLMERHRNFKHINLQTEFKCSECPKVFGHQRSLKRHYMSHHMGIKNHSCELCGKAFYRKEYLTSHMVQHTGYTVDAAKKKRSPREYKPHTYVKEEEEEVEEDNREEEEEPVRRIILHQDEHGTLRVVDMATENEVKKMLDSQIGRRSEVGETMVVQIQEPSSPRGQQVIQIGPRTESKPQVVEITQSGGQVEQQVLQIEKPGTPAEQTLVVQVENDEQNQEQVVEVPLEAGNYIEYQPVEVVEGQPPLSTYNYSSSQADIAVQANQELIYGQPAVQYEVECVGDVGDEEALSAINLLAQASAAQYENVVVSQI